MACAQIDEDEILQWILRRLGAPKVCVELTEDHVKDAIADARIWFMSNKGQVRYWKLDLVPNQTEYALIDDVDTVIDVIFQLLPTDISTLFTPISSLDERLPYDVFSTASSVGPYSTYLQLVQYIELTRRLTNAEPDWRQQERSLLIFPEPRSSQVVMVAYAPRCVDMTQMSMKDFDLFRKYALARAKEDLGRVRSKYAEWPDAQGSVQLDGDKLLSEAREDMEKLTEQLLASGNPMPFLTG